MKLTDLNLDRFLYKDLEQNLETKDAEFQGGNVVPEDVAPLASGGAAQDLNTGNVLINGQILEPGTFPQTVLDISNWGWGQTCTFSSVDIDTVQWSSGTFTSADGTSYAISAGNTGNMSAKTYIYLDILASETTYQISTNPADSVGIGKVLIGVAQNATAGNATYNLSQATQIVGDNILANSINASKITTGQLIVGTNVGLGTAQDSAGVTTIIGNTVTTGYVNALSVVAGSVAAENITGTTITGKIFKTQASGQRVELQSTLMNFYDSSGNSFSMYSTSGTLLMTSSTTSGNIILQSGSSTGTVYLKGGASGTILVTTNGAVFNMASGGSYTFQDNGSSFLGISKTLIFPNTDNSIYLGGPSNQWAGIYTESITLNGTTRTTWPTSGTTTLSGLTIDTSKNWGGYSITNCGGISLVGTGDFFNCNGGYVDFAKAIYFVDSGSSIYNAGNIIEYDSDTDHNFYINGTIKAIIDANFWTQGDLLAGGSKPFVIPHPDGSDRLLRYTAQESPEVILRHRGKATTDSTGKITIIPPTHFTLVTDPLGDVTVNITPIGDHRVFLQEEPTNSEIKIQSSTPSVSFHYEIIAVRKGYLNHPIELEENDLDLKPKDIELVRKIKKTPNYTKGKKKDRSDRVKVAKEVI